MTSTSVGIVGGLGPDSTIDYYRRIIDVWHQSRPQSSPPIVIDSLDVDRGIQLVTHDHDGLTDYLLESLHRLDRAGASFAVLAANTPHIVFDALAARSPLPLLSIVEVCADEAQRRGYNCVVLLGTGFTMGASFYPDVFVSRGIDIVVPSPEERAWLHDRYIRDLLKARFEDDTRAGVEAMVARLRTTHEFEAVVLAGTELPLLLRSHMIAGMPVLDTTELHVAAIVRRLQS
jgi:aspartate racemase